MVTEGCLVVQSSARGLLPIGRIRLMLVGDCHGWALARVLNRGKRVLLIVHVSVCAIGLVLIHYWISVVAFFVDSR